MNSQQAELLLKEIENSIKEINGFRNLTEKELSYLAGYLVVIICGIYEEAIEMIICEWAAKFNSNEINKFVFTSIDQKFRNPKIQKIIETLNNFNKNWGDEISILPDPSKEALNSIIGIKNQLAHKGSANITLGEVINYYNRSKEIIEKIDDLLLS